jgi:hypothetical protein
MKDRRKHNPFLKVILIEKVADMLLVHKARKLLAKMKKEDLIPFSEATRLAGWEK